MVHTAYVWNQEAHTLGSGSGWVGLGHTLLTCPQEQGSGNHSPYATYGPPCFHKVSRLRRLVICLLLSMAASSLQHRVYSCQRDCMAENTIWPFTEEFANHAQDSLANAVIKTLALKKD